MAKTETQAEKNKRIEGKLKSRGAKFTSKAQIDAQNKRIAAKKPTTPATEKTSTNGKTTRRSGTEYFSGKKFDETTRKVLKESGI